MSGSGPTRACEPCRAALRMFETLAQEIARASVPLPRERTTLAVLVEKTRERIQAIACHHDDRSAARRGKAASA